MSKQIRVPDELAPELSEFMEDVRCARLMEIAQGRVNGVEVDGRRALSQALAYIVLARTNYRTRYTSQPTQEGVRFTPVSEVHSGNE